jgi:hypothetical protein
MFGNFGKFYILVWTHLDIKIKTYEELRREKRKKERRKKEKKKWTEVGQFGPTDTAHPDPRNGTVPSLSPPLTGGTQLSGLFSNFYRFPRRDDCATISPAPLDTKTERPTQSMPPIPPHILSISPSLPSLKLPPDHRNCSPEPAALLPLNLWVELEPRVPSPSLPF